MGGRAPEVGESFQMRFHLNLHVNEKPAMGISRMREQHLRRPCGRDRLGIGNAKNPSWSGLLVSKGERGKRYKKRGRITVLTGSKAKSDREATAEGLKAQ